MKKVCLVCMPFCAVKSPSLGLSLLKPAARRDGLDARIFYGNIDFFNFIGGKNYKLLEFCAFAYMQFVENVFEYHVGYRKVPPRQEVIDCIMQKFPKGKETFLSYGRLMEQIEPLIPIYLDNLCKKILAEKPDVVGCTCIFSQLNANLALMKRLKELAPEVITVMGGCSISVTAGQALVDHMDQLDYVFVGESDDIFGEALTLMAEGKTDELHDRFPAVLYKGGEPGTHAICDMDSLPYPDFDDYFEALREYDLINDTPVTLPVEASRGCWWGCKEPCRFCGLHIDQDVLQYRKKSSRRFADELEYLSQRYQVKNFILSDSILAREHIRELPALLADCGYSLFAEVKTNMTREEMHGLSIAGFTVLQPGIESINDQILRLMNKGNRGIKHVEFLKNAKAEGITLMYNLMQLIPGEKEEWYYEDLKIFPLLFHLQAPNGSLHVFQRGSTFTEHAEEYGIELRPLYLYKYIFEEELIDDSRFPEFYEPVEIPSASYIEPVANALSEWARAFHIAGCQMSYRIEYGFLMINDSRPCAIRKNYIFVGLEKDVCLLADQAIEIDKLYESCQGYPQERVEETLQELIDLKLLLKMGNEVIFLAVPGRSAAKDR